MYLPISVWIAVLALSGTVSLRAEEQFAKDSTASPLQDEFSVVNTQWTDKSSWSLSLQYKHKDYPPGRNTDAISATKEWATSDQRIDECKGFLAEHELTRKYESNIVEFLGEVSLLADGFACFLDAKLIEPPIRFAKRDSLTTVILTGLATETVFNTLRSTARSRAGKVIQSISIATLKKFVKSFRDTEIDRLGVCVVYGSKDFSNDSDVLNLEPEVVAIVSPKHQLIDFLEGRVSEDSLVASSTIYLSDRDMRVEFKKIEIDLE
ncbi:hypothetical protein IT157_06890 [bacterium]|nr:hypothetical protein [bacterium]